MVVSRVSVWKKIREKAKKKKKKGKEKGKEKEKKRTQTTVHEVFCGDRRYTVHYYSSVLYSTVYGTPASTCAHKS